MTPDDPPDQDAAADDAAEPTPATPTPSEPRPERRAHARANLGRRIFFHHKGRFVPAEALNIGEGGVAAVVENKEPPAAGAKIGTRLSVTPEDRKAMWHEIPSRVVEVEAVSDEKWIVAAAFVRLDPDAKRDIAAWVKSAKRRALERKGFRSGGGDGKGISVAVSPKDSKGRRR